MWGIDNRGNAIGGLGGGSNCTRAGRYLTAKNYTSVKIFTKL
jgi:hypothetical protein